MRKTEPLQRAIKAVGTADKLAAGLGISAQAISQWSDIPLKRVFDVEKLTGIPHQELRPDFFDRESV
jgi:DNA-binding transcriptional regulator YdaS (Cro superfamily)